MVSSNNSNPHPPMKFMRSWEKGFVRFVMKILIQNMNVVTKDIHSSSCIKKGKMNEWHLFHKERKDDVHKESIKVEDIGQKEREPDICGGSSNKSSRELKIPIVPKCGGKGKS